MKKHEAKRLKEVDKKIKTNKKADRKSAKNKNRQAEDEIFNFDNEIVIGVTKLPEKKTNKKKSKQPKKQKNNKKTKKQNKASKEEKSSAKKTTKIQPNKKIDLKKEKRKRRIKVFAKGVLITTAIIGAILAFLLSPIFALSNIKVEGISKISENEIKILSELNIGENIFTINNNTLINKIKSNPYVEDAKIKKLLPDEILIEIIERKATYALKCNGKYVYINNQGYILEEADSTNNLTEMISYKTPVEEIKVGSRLSGEDLELLGIILKITESANNNELSNLITSIDIGDKNDIILSIESERKNSILRKCIRHKH